MKWVTSTLDELFEIARGGSPRPIKDFITTAADGINWIRIGDAEKDGKYIWSTEQKIKPAGMRRSRFVKTGDFILSNSMSFGRPYILKTDGCIHDGWLLLRPRAEGIDENFLYYALSSDIVFEQFDRLAAGSVVRNLNVDAVKSVSIAFPALPEQRRIVGILDEAFAGIATAKANAEKNLRNARSLFTIELDSAYMGREANCWPERRLGDVFEIGSSKRIHERDWSPSGVPFYGGKEIVKLARYGEAVSNAYISEMKYCEYAEKYDMPKQGDILITARGTIGVGYVVRDGDKFYYKDGNIISMRAKEPMNPQFLLNAFRSNAMANQLGELSGTTVTHLPLEKAKALWLRTPPFEVQNALIKKLDRFELETERLSIIYQQKLAALDALKNSLLHQAFSGQLTGGNGRFPETVGR